jgi:hypothetical protein
LPHFRFPRRLRDAPESDVFPNGTVEEKNILLHDAMFCAAIAG